MALLEIDDPPADLVPAPFGDSDSLLTGNNVIVVGAPYGLSYTLSVGYVSGRLTPGLTVNGVPLEFIQTDANLGALLMLGIAATVVALFVVCMVCLIGAMFLYFWDINLSLKALRLEIPAEARDDVMGFAGFGK